MGGLQYGGLIWDGAWNGGPGMGGLELGAWFGGLIWGPPMGGLGL